MTLEDKLWKLYHSLDERIETLHKHEAEYKEEGKEQLAKESVLKANQLMIVASEISKILKEEETAKEK